MRWKRAALVAILAFAICDRAAPTGTPPTVVHRIGALGGGGSHPNPDKPRISRKTPGGALSSNGKANGSPP